MIDSSKPGDVERPFHDDDADVARLRAVDHLDRVLGGGGGRRLIGGHGADQRRDGAADERSRHHRPDVVVEEAALAGDLVHRVGDVGRAQLRESRQHRIRGRRGRGAGRLRRRRLGRGVGGLRRQQAGGHGQHGRDHEMAGRQGDLHCGTP